MPTQTRWNFPKPKPHEVQLPEKRWTQGPCWVADASDQLAWLRQSYAAFRYEPDDLKIIGSMKDQKALDAVPVGIEADPPDGPERWFFQLIFEGNPIPGMFPFGLPQNIIPR